MDRKIVKLLPITYQQYFKTYTGLIMTQVFEIILIPYKCESPPEISSMFVFPHHPEECQKILLLRDNVRDLAQPCLLVNRVKLRISRSS